MATDTAAILYKVNPVKKHKGKTGGNNMKQHLTKILTLALAVVMVLSMSTVALAAENPFEPGPITLQVSAAEQINGSYKVSYTAKLVMLEELAKVATIYRDNYRMQTLRFICTLNDELVTQYVGKVEEDDFRFDCAQWKGKDIFVFEDAAITEAGLKITYSLNDAVLDDWFYTEDMEAVTAALRQPMTMWATATVPGRQLDRIGSTITTTGMVELEGTGIEKYYEQYSVIGAWGKTVWRWDDTHSGGHIHGIGGCRPHDCPRNIYCPAGHFEDLDLQLWYHDGIHFCAEHGLMIGTSRYEFEPYLPITRGMVVTVLYRMEGEPAVSNTQVYDDVALGKWYSKGVEWADSTGVVNGYGNGNFGPNDPITREQMAAVLYRYAKYLNADLTPHASLDSFKDSAKVSKYAVPAMEWACGAGLVQGSNGNLMPLDNTTRAQAAALFQRYCFFLGSY